MVSGGRGGGVVGCWVDWDHVGVGVSVVALLPRVQVHFGDGDGVTGHQGVAVRMWSD